LSGIILPVDFSAAYYQSKGYIVSTAVYEGPLDLLLHLIERAELDITKLSLAHVTDQYLEHLRAMQEHRAEEVSAFLVIASKLLQIKSEALLPRPPVREPGEEDPGEALVRQLIIYKRFKDIANRLAQRETEGLHTYLRLAPVARFDSALDLGGLTLADLFSAAQSVFIKIDDRVGFDDVIELPRITIREKIHQIAAQLRQQGRVSFLRLFSERPTNTEIIVTFLAMLELIKRRLVRVSQEALFAEIFIENEGLSDENEVFELEFGE
jgi:segregation and condensation protein A